MFYIQEKTHRGWRSIKRCSFKTRAEAEAYMPSLDQDGCTHGLRVIGDKFYLIFVDGIAKGEAVKRNGRWCWRRPSGALDTFPRRTKLETVLEWARTCCNGKVAEIVTKED